MSMLTDSTCFFLEGFPKAMMLTSFLHLFLAASASFDNLDPQKDLEYENNLNPSNFISGKETEIKLSPVRKGWSEKRANKMVGSVKQLVI